MERTSRWSRVVPACARRSKAFTAFFLLGATSSFVGVAAAQDQTRIAVVDVSKVFGGYYKTKEVEKLIVESRRAAAREVDSRMENHHRLLEDIARLDKDLANPALDETAKADRRKKREAKVTETHRVEHEVQDLKAARDRSLQELATRLRNQIVEDIMVVVRARVESKHYDLVLNESAQGTGGKVLVLHAGENLELTEDVIATLNRSRLGAAPAASPGL